MEYRSFVQNMVESYLEHLGKKAIFIKHYNTLDITLSDMLENVCSQRDYVFLFHEYQINKMKGAYEPFLAWAKICYDTFYKAECTVEEFVERCDVYTLQREVISGYIRDGVCKRGEEFLLEECEYEKSSMLKSLYGVFSYVAREHELIMVISKLHMTSLSALSFINYAFRQEDNIHFIFTYNDVFHVRSYIQREWEKLIHVAENCHMILEWGKVESQQSMDLQDDFIYSEDHVEEYIAIAANMYFMLTFEDARYYLELIFEKITRRDTRVSKVNRLKLLALYSLSVLGMYDKNQALLICEKMVPLIEEEDAFFAYIYNYLAACSHLLMVESELTYKFCSQCRRYAKILQNEKLQFQADVIECIANFGTLREIFRCNYNYSVSEEMIQKTKKFEYHNFLAYLYIFGFENDAEAIEGIAMGKRQAVYFDKGIDIAKRLGNNNLQRVAYMKNIVLYSEYGFHQYVRTMYERRLEVMDADDQVQKGHIYSGMGYNSIVLEKYKEADRYFQSSLSIMITHQHTEDIAEVIYNMALNYFIAGLNENASECIECILMVTNLLHIQGIRICNTSKLYGIMALANYKMGQYYNCYYCLNKSEAILRHILNKGEDADFKMWEEDLFLYHLTKAVMYAYEKEADNALQEFDQAYFFMNQLSGVKFYTYAEYAIMRSRFCREQGRLEEAQSILSEAYNYCTDNGHHYKAEQIQAEMSGAKCQEEALFVPKEIPFDEILRIARYSGVKVQLEAREYSINFLTVYQDMLMREQRSVEQVRNVALNLIQNTFNLDRIVVLRTEGEEPEIEYSNGEISLSLEDMRNIRDFFVKNQQDFLVNRTNKNFQKYLPVIAPFGEDNVTTIIGIPSIREEKVKMIFIGIIELHRNFSGNRKLLEDENLPIFKFAAEQLDEAVRRTEDAKMIEKMNLELQKSVVTDRLTGVYNRFGLDQILNQLTEDTGAVIYMDLDNFKYYNDHYGHHVGDEILILFADILRCVVEEKGSAIRYGGDEFVIIYPGKTQTEAVEIVKEIMYQLETKLKQQIHARIQHIQMPEEGREITCSMGIAEYQGHSFEDMEAALKKADAALYYIKRRTKGRYAVWSAMCGQIDA